MYWPKLDPMLRDGIEALNTPRAFSERYTLVVSGAGSGDFVQSLFRTLLDLPTQILTWKSAFLLAITSARRASEMHTLSCETVYHRFLSAGVTLFTKPSFLAKVPTKANTIRPILVSIMHK